MNTLRKHRRKNRWTMDEAKDRCDICFRQLYYKYENGDNLPSLKNAFKISIGFGVPLEELFPDEWGEAKREIDKRKELIKKKYEQYD